MSASKKCRTRADERDLPCEVDRLLAELSVSRERYTNGTITVHTPITGEPIGLVQQSGPDPAKPSQNRSGTHSLRRVATGGSAQARRARSVVWRGTSRQQGCPRPVGFDRGWQDRLGRTWRGPGDDRYLRFRGRSVSPALRPYHCYGARRASDDGELASAWRDRNHLCFQFPNRRLGVTQRSRWYAATALSGNPQRRRH